MVVLCEKVREEGPGRSCFKCCSKQTGNDLVKLPRRACLYFLFLAKVVVVVEFRRVAGRGGLTQKGGAKSTSSYECRDVAACDLIRIWRPRQARRAPRCDLPYASQQIPIPAWAAFNVAFHWLPLLELLWRRSAERLVIYGAEYLRKRVCSNEFYQACESGQDPLQMNLS